MADRAAVVPEVPAKEEKAAAQSTRCADVLIIGGGFAGFSCFKEIDRKKRSVTLLTHRNHFLFTPLLPSAATGSVEIRSIIEPLRSFQEMEDEVIVAEVLDLDPVRKKVTGRFENVEETEIYYRTLVIAAGAVTATYGIPGVERNCLFMKETKDARALREHILAQFERAEHLNGKAKEIAMTFVLVGGGPTGVETACDIHDLINRDLRGEFPEHVDHVKIMIIEAGKEILTVFDRALVQYAQAKLRQKKIEVLTSSPVHQVEKDRVILADGRRINSETIIWVAGNGVNPFVRRISERLKVPLDRQGRIPVDPKLRIVNAGPDIFAIGDCAAASDGQNRPLPATGQVAQKQGRFLGRFLSGLETGPFHFRAMGMLASLGSGSAIADLGRFHFKGVLAWWFWKGVYLTKLVSTRNKFSVAFDWIKVRLFGRNTASVEDF